MRASRRCRTPSPRNEGSASTAAGPELKKNNIRYERHIYRDSVNGFFRECGHCFREQQHDESSSLVTIADNTIFSRWTPSGLDRSAPFGYDIYPTKVAD